MKKHLLYTFLILTLFATVACSKDDEETQWEEPVIPNNPGGSGESKTGYHNGYEYIDLGLPSGTKWATCNVGADSPEDYGGYYAWGETTEYVASHYDWDGYIWCQNSMERLTKYNRNEYFGKVDNKTTLELRDDAAYNERGGKWRMPTTEEWKELLEECVLYNTEVNGVAGKKVVGPNGKSIFLPAAGLLVGAPWNENVGYNGKGCDEGYYWGNSLLPYGYGYSDYIAYAIMFDADPGTYSSYYDIERCHGASVRPVIGEN